jgi:hypothetical protein
MCHMVTKFVERILRAIGRPIKIKRIIQEFSYVENHVGNISNKSKNISSLINLRNCGIDVWTTFRGGGL